MLDTDTNPASGERGARQELSFGESSPALHSQIEMPPQELRELVLAELRHISACLRFITCEVDLVGHYLRTGIIDARGAQEWVNSLEDPAGFLHRESTP